MTELKTEEGTETKEEYRENFLRARNGFIAELEGLSDDDLEKPVVEGFSSKDLAAHILAWV